MYSMHETWTRGLTGGAVGAICWIFLIIFGYRLMLLRKWCHILRRDASEFELCNKVLQECISEIMCTFSAKFEILFFFFFF